jgi:hypothetical protein
MARPYSAELRERVVRAVEGRASRRATAANFEVSVSCVARRYVRAPWRARGGHSAARPLEEHGP